MPKQGTTKRATPKGGIPHLRDSMTLDPRLQQIVSDHSQGRLDAAESGYRTWLSTHPDDAFVLHQLGIIGLQRGRPDLALPFLETAGSLNPGNATALQHWGDALSGLRRHAEAEQIYRRGLSIDSDHIHLRLHLGNALRALGRPTESERAYREVLMHDPTLARAHCNLGHVLADQRRFPEASESFDRAFSLGDTSLETVIGASQARLELGESVRCETLIRDGLKRAPQDARLLSLLGESLRRRKSFTEAEGVLRKAVSFQPAPLAAWHNLGKLLIDRSRPQEAEAVFRQLLTVAPEHPEVQLGLSLALMALRRRLEAETVLRRLTSQHPKHTKAWIALARAVLDRFPTEGLACAQQAIALDPDDNEATAVLAEALAQNGDACAALETQRRILTRPNPDPSLVSSLLAMAGYAGTLSAGETLRIARAWSDSLPRSALSSPLTSPFEARPLKVGYVSADFRDHAVVSFFEPILEAHLAQSLDVSLYASLPTPDAVTKRLQSRLPADRWHFIHSLSAYEAANLIRSHGIDILVDLGGHTRGNRLGIFAQRAAPVQACYLGYYATTGLAEMDYWIGDETILPSSLGSGFTEELWRLPRCWLSYRAPADCPPPSRQDDGHGLTFGSFNNRQKISSRTLDLWAQVLRQVTDSRMIVKTAGLEDASQREALAKAFSSRGIDPQRVILRATTLDRKSHLQQYQEIDIALDTTPFSGGTTTAESLWMGVPVLTLLGDSMPGRMSASFLRALGLNEWIADSDNAFAELGRMHAERMRTLSCEERSASRRALRSSMETSPLVDANGLACHLADAYRSMRDAALVRNQGPNA